MFAFPVYSNEAVNSIQKGFKREKALAEIAVLSDVYKTAIHSQNDELKKKVEAKISVLMDEI